MTNRIALASILLFASSRAEAQVPVKTAEYTDFYADEKTNPRQWKQVIDIKSPQLRSTIAGEVKVEFSAPGMKKAVAFCWQQPTKNDSGAVGHDSQLGPKMTLDAIGQGSFLFRANQFPRGPINIRILAWNDAERDSRELQLFNNAGVSWNEGLPKSPAAAEGMKLVFADDFNGPLSISNNGQGAQYTSHKPGGGDFSGWPFSDFEGEHNPFSQTGTYLRIHASKDEGGTGSTGLMAPVKPDGSVLTAKSPVYFECRFLAQSVPSAWPAFWLLTQNKGTGGEKDETDELDVIEAYGGQGPGNPNFQGYEATTHFWGQKDAVGKPLPDPHLTVKMPELTNGNSWSKSFHTYGVKITSTDTVYYLDNVEVFRHPSGAISKTQPFFFLINYAIGGISGWKIDLAREGNASDMYVDWVRVFEGGK